MSNYGIIPALDTNLENAVNIIQNLKDVSEAIKGYKIGSLLIYECGLKKTVETIKEKTQIPIIFDAQKGSTDIPDIVYSQIELAAKFGVSEVIACPHGAGLESLKSFVSACEINNVTPICVIEMTHPSSQKYLKSNANEEVLKDALSIGIKKFVVPATKADRVKYYINLIKDFGFSKNITLMTTGIAVQGGKLSEMKELGVNQFIMGRTLINSMDPRKVVLDSYNEIK